MTTRLYMILLGGVSLVAVLGVLILAAVKERAHRTPNRPASLPASAVWRETPSDEFTLTPHGDWIACREQDDNDYCELTDARGAVEFEGPFASLPGQTKVPAAHLRPVTSETITPWMWSNHANRQVPMIHLEDGTVLAPSGSAADLQAYVTRMKKMSEQPKPGPGSYQSATGR